MKKFVIAVEFYDSSNEEGPAILADGMFHIMTGFKLFHLSLDKVDSDDNVLDIILARTIALIKSLNEKPSEYIKATFPNYYRVSLTKQFWYHVFEEGYIDRNKIPTGERSIDIEDKTFEEIMGESDGPSENVIIPLDIFLNKDFERLYGPPERITNDEFWNDILGEM